jgi:hypothetical protein
MNPQQHTTRGRQLSLVIGGKFLRPSPTRPEQISLAGRVPQQGGRLEFASRRRGGVVSYASGLK